MVTGDLDRVRVPLSVCSMCGMWVPTERLDEHVENHGKYGGERVQPTTLHSIAWERIEEPVDVEALLPEVDEPEEEWVWEEVEEAAEEQEERTEEHAAEESVEKPAVEGLVEDQEAAGLEEGPLRKAAKPCDCHDTTLQSIYQVPKRHTSRKTNSTGDFSVAFSSYSVPESS